MREHFVNIAGVGYIQGLTAGVLDGLEIKHKVTIDGMFGPSTIEGLELAVRNGWRIQFPPFVDTRDFLSNDDYLVGIEVFQKWYEHVRKHVHENYPAKAKIWLKGQTDGIWGDKTQTSLMIALAPFVLHNK